MEGCGGEGGRCEYWDLARGALVQESLTRIFTWSRMEFCGAADLHSSATKTSTSPVHASFSSSQLHLPSLSHVGSVDWLHLEGPSRRMQTQTVTEFRLQIGRRSGLAVLADETEGTTRGSVKAADHAGEPTIGLC